MNSSKNNPNDVFWLARYAHNKLAPLFAQAKAIEPSIKYNIELGFADTDSVYHGNYIGIASHWNREGMFQHASWLRTKAEVDQFVAKVADDVATLSPLVTA